MGKTIQYYGSSVVYKAPKVEEVQPERELAEPIEYKGYSIQSSHHNKLGKRGSRNGHPYSTSVHVRCKSGGSPIKYFRFGTDDPTGLKTAVARATRWIDKQEDQ